MNVKSSYGRSEAKTFKQCVLKKNRAQKMFIIYKFDRSHIKQVLNHGLGKITIMKNRLGGKLSYKEIWTLGNLF